MFFQGHWRGFAGTADEHGTFCSESLFLLVLFSLIPRANCASCSPVDTDLLMTTIRTYWIRERDTELSPLILLAG